MNYRNLACCFLILLSRIAFAQQETATKFTIQLDKGSFETLVTKVEGESNFRFYFSTSRLDTLKFTVNAIDKPLNEVLDMVFDGSLLHYSIDHNKVYILYNMEVQTDLPAGFFTQRSGDTIALPQYVPKVLSQADEKLKQAESNLFVIGKKSTLVDGKTANVAGHVTNVDNGEPVIGAIVFIENPTIGVATDPYGYYSVTLPVGRHELFVSSIGMKKTSRQIILYSEGKLDVSLKEDVVPLREIIVEADRDINVAGMQMGVDKLDLKSLRQVPTAFGETDIMKVALALPGVQSVGESSVGLNVRGGTPDQNLILYNDAVIYNPSHLFGFFSAFNPDMLKDVELHKSAVPASYGGRLSSVMEISSREGNKKSFEGAGGIGVLTSRFSIDGPIIKDKLSFVVGGRATYSDWILGRLNDRSFRNSKASFYDINANFNYEVNEKNTLFFSVYNSEDQFRLNSDTLYSYNNQAVSLKWKHIFENKLYGVFSATGSKYRYNVESDENIVNAFKMDYQINQFTSRADFNYFPDSKNSIDFGIGTMLYDINPGSISPQGDSSIVTPKTLEKEKALESSFYVGNTYLVNSKFMVYGGLRYVIFNAFGPRTVYSYANNLNKDEGAIIDTTFFTGGIIKTYQGPEARLSLRYLLAGNASLKLSYNRMRQFVHLLSNTTAVSPTDSWKLSDSHIKPSVGDQYTIGFYKNFPVKAVETSVEVYYKKTSDYLDYKNGANLLLNSHLETDVFDAIGKAYGIELLIKKQKGKLSGWLSYTYSRSFFKSDPTTTIELVNHGEYYRSNFDKPHDATLISNYQFSKRFSMSFNFTYSTGRPITLPLQQYQLGNEVRINYSERNEYRIPDYYRADFAINLEGNHRVKKLAHSSWTFSVYNLTGRKNAYSVYFTSENGTIKGYKLSIFGRPIPTLTYNFRF